LHLHGPDAAAQIGEAIGGGAGVIALVWNIKDAARHRKAGRAPELRALLSQTVAVLDEVIKEARVDDWFREKLYPVYMELDRLLPVLSGRIKSDLGPFGRTARSSQGNGAVPGSASS
jgi:hypothetical protein